jgi:predicted DNA-binding transcriptional regulator YafY
MYSPTTRVLAVLELLQTLGRASGAELARRLQVDARTLRRYIARLEDMGIPVTAERGRYGCYALMPGFKLPPMMFDEAEALAVSVGLIAARQLGVAGTAPAVESARAKLERVMPAPLRQRVHALGETVQLDLARSSAAADHDTLLALAEAAHARTRVALRYQAAGRPVTEREVDVYGVALRGGSWYAVGHCHLRRELRSFRVDRVRGVQARGERFEPPADFDAVRHLALGMATLPRTHGITVLLKTDMATAREQLFASIGVFQSTERGLLLHSQADDLRWFARQLARLSCEFEVIAPRHLKTEVARHARQLLAQVAPRRTRT